MTSFRVSARFFQEKGYSYFTRSPMIPVSQVNFIIRDLIPA